MAQKNKPLATQNKPVASWGAHRRMSTIERTTIEDAAKIMCIHADQLLWQLKHYGIARLGDFVALPHLDGTVAVFPRTAGQKPKS
jgi:hypothetical protein